MATMNPANTGGPVGGGMMMMNNGSPAVSAGMGSNDNLKAVLNTWVFDYLLKHGHYDIARSVVRDDKFEMKTEPKSSPGRRKDGDMNGDGGDMDMNIKDDVPDDLPRPHGWDGNQSSGFLLEWFSIFYDLLQAHRLGGGSNKLNGAMNMNPAATYLLHEKQMQRMRESAQNQNLNRPGMNPAMMRQMQNGAINGNMNKQLTPQQMQQLQQSRKAQQMAMQQQLQRGDQPEGEMNGARPGTPADGDNGGSPSKRPRLDNGQQQFNNGMMQNGRPGGVPGAANQGMMIQAGFQPGMNPQFRGNAAMQPKGMQGGMANGMMNMGNAGSPMMQGMNQFPPDNMAMDMSYQRNMQGGQPGMQGGGGGQSGNHALQDYQMQLMLLEQQNKKRLMMARQEQHENNPGSGPMPVGMQGTGMSPNGSRTGTSPNPGEMKRTPGMGGLPGSPSAAEAMAGRSPVGGMGFMGNMQNPDFNGGMFMGAKDQPMMGAGPGMRPPTSAEINSMRQQGARGNNQFPGGAPMVQQASQGGQQGMGTPGQRNEMPPPQAPAGAAGAQRNAGGSPSNNNAPPTPSQANKPNPKTKKGATKEDTKRQRPTKKNSAANTNANEDNPPVTPTPSTPINANNPGVMNAANKGQPGMQQNNQHQQQNPGMQMSQQMDQPELGQGNTFGDFNSQDPQFNLDFSTLENADVLENFDFDSFLNTSAGDTFDFNADIGVGGDFGMNQPE